MRGKFGLVLLATASIAATASADISYVAWNSGTATSSSASGTITLPDSSTIGASVSGPLKSVQGSAEGTFYWTNGSTYTGTGVPNAPGTNDIVEIIGGGDSTYTVTFDRPVTGLVMDLLSVGASGAPVVYNFDHSFTLVNSGPGYWGSGPLTSIANSIIGEEGHGVIRFDGTLTTVTWTVPTGENWHGFEFGVAGAAVPEPATLGALGLGALALLRKRRKAA